MKPVLLIVGLGNPGVSHSATRHNAGFRAVDLLRESFGVVAWKRAEKFDASLAQARVVTVPVLLCKPQTYMNDSGTPVHRIVDFYKLDPATQLLVLCDDIDLTCGTLRLRKQGSAGTHNGLKSLCAQFGEHYPRLRIGIGPKPDGVDLAAWVLSVAPPAEDRATTEAIATIPDLVRSFILENSPHSA